MSIHVMVLSDIYSRVRNHIFQQVMTLKNGSGRVQLRHDETRCCCVVYLYATDFVLCFDALYSSYREHQSTDIEFRGLGKRARNTF